MIKLVIFILLFPLFTQAKTIRIAVIDSGIDSNYKVKLCKTGHKDFTNTSLDDLYGHGTNISAIIDAFNKETDYCQIIIKAFHPGITWVNYVEIWEYVAKLNPDVINFSAGGPFYDPKEIPYIKKVLDKGIVWFNAAGNDGSNLDLFCSFYPLCLDERIIGVGNLMSNKDKHPTSNYGKRVNIWVLGTNIKAGGFIMTGTSQANAMASGVYVRMLGRNRH